MRQRFQWRTGKRTLEMGRRTIVMGIVNVTPDSFSDGGFFLDADAAVAHGLQLLSEGADILDIGGESTRPGAAVAPDLARVGEKVAVSAEAEISRVVPVIQRLLRERRDTVISIDTYKSEVARAAIAAGAEIVNDVSGGLWDERMLATVAELGCGCVLMHMRGRPETWRSLPPFEDTVSVVCSELRERAGAAIGAGVSRECIVLDPGLGFGKSFDENYPLLAHLDELAKLGFPLLSGPSRKSFIGRTVGRRISEASAEAAHDQPPSERLYGTLATIVASVLNGAHVVRVHDVRPALEAVAVADAVLAAE